MDPIEEPQKKVFKARKTMKVSDRHQLEALHKAKEDLLRPTDLKLFNGSSENGDSDINSLHTDTGCLEDKSDLHGTIDFNCDKLLRVDLSDVTGLSSVEQVSDLERSQELYHSASSAHHDKSKDLADTVGLVPSVISNDPLRDDQKVLEKDVLMENDALMENVLDVEISEHSLSNISIEGESPTFMEAGKAGTLENGNPGEDVGRELKTILDTHGDKDQETEVFTFDLPEMDKECNTENIMENVNQDCNEVGEKDCHSDQKQHFLKEGNLNVKEQSSECVHTQGSGLMFNAQIESEERLNTEDPSSLQDVGEVAISSTVVASPTLKPAEQNCTIIEGASPNKPVSDLHPANGSACLETMETDEIIPILEKLAPVEDELQNFSKPSLNSQHAADEENSESITASPSKNDGNTSLPNEAFLVLSDEEELHEEENVSGKKDAGIVDTKEARGFDHETQQESVNLEAEKLGEVLHRKRSKSEDLDVQSSKRRRFESEEYEAELKVKITAGDDLNKKLHKIIQRLFEEKLGALQCAYFDKAVEDLKTRVEKLECKKHEMVLHSIQAKISRLSKRFGAAKEDLKKRPEQSTAAQTSSPGKSTVNESANQVSNLIATNYRNPGTVRQMLESKRGVGETTTTNSPMSNTVPSSVSSSSNLTLRTSYSSQIPVTPSPSNGTIQTRAPPDWKLIQQKINAQNTPNAQSKPSTPITSSPIMPSVLPTPSAPAVGSSPVSSNNTQPVSVSLQSLPVILHVPVAVSSQSQILQGATGTLVTNQQSGNVEFIPVQNQSTLNNPKSPVTIAVTKSINSPSVPSPSIQKNSPASSISSSMTVQAVPANHPVTISRASLSTVGTSGIYNQTSNRNNTQSKSSGLVNSSESSLGRTDLQNSRVPATESVVNKRTPETNSQIGKSAGVIDLTLDDEESDLSSQDSKRASSSVLTNLQPSQSVVRQSQTAQMSNPQSSAPLGLTSQATMHVVPTAQTTVNITQRPGAQSATRTSPRVPSAGHMVYTTATLPNAPAPIRNTVMQNQIRQMTPQVGGVPVRMPQTATYVVNNGMQMGTGPQLTVHHRPQQEAAKPIHPAPLPEAPQPQRLPTEAASTSAPQKPHLKLARVQSQNGIVLSWSVLEVDRSCAAVDNYHLYAYHEDPSATSPSQWKKIGEVKALPLPMACTLTQFVSGSKYYFAVRAKDVYGRFGPFCDPQSTDVISNQGS